MSHINRSIIHLSLLLDDNILSSGTGFLYKYKENFYIVTAWHNLSGKHPDTLKSISKKLAIPNYLLANIPVSNGDGFANITIKLKLFNSSKSLYFVHSQKYPKIDLAVIPLDKESTYEIGQTYDGQVINLPIFKTDGFTIHPIQDFLFNNKSLEELWFNNVDVTEELFIPGYPQNIFDETLQPVWKRATLASQIKYGWNRQRKFVVDSASKSGMSGSPVIYYNSRGEFKSKGLTHYSSKPVAILTGVYVGRLGETKSTDNDPQVGIVWRDDLIPEIIEEKKFEFHPNDYEICPSERNIIINNHLSSKSDSFLESIKSGNIYSRNETIIQILEITESRCSQEKISEGIDEYLSKNK